MTPPDRLLVLAPNWLGDAVMALPLLAAIRRGWPQTTLIVAARPSVLSLFSMVEGVHATMLMESDGDIRKLRTIVNDVEQLRQQQADAALLLPNSFFSAWLVWRAGVPERWGMARDLRSPLLTRPVPPPRDFTHHVDYYNALAGALGLPAADRFASVSVSDAARQQAQALLGGHGVARDQPVVVMAPGAAYGRAKQWLPSRYAEVARLARQHDWTSVLVGTAADRDTCQKIAAVAPVVDLCGQTDLPTLAGVLAGARHVVANDSGAMHLAAAVGAPLTAIFGPTNEHRTSPLRAHANAPSAAVVSTPVFCRPCMLRECPIDHRCMTRISAEQVFQTIA